MAGQQRGKKTTVRAQNSNSRSGAFQESTEPQSSVWAFRRTRAERRGAPFSHFSGESV
jgi:hypothetical protein